MALLEYLDYYYKVKQQIKQDNIEVEYRLYSWGEISSSLLSDRTIFNDFPFKLYSSSDKKEPLPQKLCLTFYQVPRQAGISSHLVAREFTAFLSMVTRRRVFASKMIRLGGLPIEQDINLYNRLHFQEEQLIKVIDPKEFYLLLESLRIMDRQIANGFLLAMRLYHSAVEMIYTEPEFSYLFLVTCLEAISFAAYKDFKPFCIDDYLDSRYPKWRSIAVTLMNENSNGLKSLLLENENYAFQKFRKFVKENAPKYFWSERCDDAKPYLSKEDKKSSLKIEDYEKIDKKKLNEVLRNIYDARSDLVHKGISFTAFITYGHFSRVPDVVKQKSIQIIQQSQNKNFMKIPPLTTFERLVSYSLVGYLRKQTNNG